MKTIRLIHWNIDEAGKLASGLVDLGYQVVAELPAAPQLLISLREDPPAALVIDLSRLPSHSRDMAVAVRKNKKTRQVPLIFCGGDPQKVALIRELLPDAVYTTWNEIGKVLAEAIAHPPAKPVVPESVFAGYSGTPLPKKLGIKAGNVVGVIDPPKGFLDALGELPEKVSINQGAQGGCDLALWFVRSAVELKSGKTCPFVRSDIARVWVLWPKKTSAIRTDLGEREVREAGLAAGWVDYKVAAIDETWSGLLFARKKEKREGRTGNSNG